MQSIRNFINKLSNFQRLTFIIVMLAFTFAGLLSISTPTLADPNASIKVGEVLWDNLRYELNGTNTVNSNTNITFSIENTELEKYYYISNSSTALTQEEIDSLTWTSYTDPVEISEEGSYVVYVKLVDLENNATYLNTDLLVLDKTIPTASISIDSNAWNDLRDTLNTVNINSQKYATPVTVEATDALSGISNIKYYISDKILSTTELDALSDWIDYSNPISIKENGTFIVYAKIADKSGNFKYINTDNITFNGYVESLIIGRNPTSYLDADPYITNNSVITLNSNYSNSSSELVDHTHNLISNILLPLGTKVTLIDNVTETVYEYKIATSDDIYGYDTSCEEVSCKVATYPFTLFKEIGTGTTDKPYVESTYYTDGKVNESFTIVVDLSGTSIVTNYNDVALYMELHDITGVNARPTIYNTISKFNVYSTVGSENANASLSLTTDYSGDTIEFNSDSSTDINITSKLDYKSIDTHKVIDTRYEDKEMGLSIKLVDSEGNVVDKEHLKSIIFKVENNIYYPEEDSIVRINLNSGINDATKALTIITSQNNGDLEEGTYYFKISNYASYDGHYYDELGNTELSIPVNVLDNTSNEIYSFGVIMDDTNLIIDKKNESVNVSFNILQKGEFEEPNIRVSLYKKTKLTAYNQEYAIVDLASYVSDTLNMQASNIYYVSTTPVQYNEPDYLYNNFELNLITSNFENTGYKYVFELYDGTKKIGTIEKYFIVK